jgi:nitroreductase / dihydropteridine reductase
MATFLSRLEWRNATKKFDAAQKVSQADLDKICEAVRMAPTSFGLQPFYVKVITQENTKSQMQAAGWGQPQFPTSTACLVFVARNDVLHRIDEMLTLRSGGDSSKRAQMKDYEEMMKGFASAKSEAELTTWAQKQCYIALGFAMAACAELGVDSCPMEGFSSPDFDRILNLPKGHTSTVVLAVGKAAADFTPFPKFRFPKSDLFKN